MRIIQKRHHASWHQHIKLWLQALRKEDLAPQTLAAYEHDIYRFSQWLMASDSTRSLSSLTDIDIIEYRQHLISVGLKPSTVNRRLGSIQRLCRWAVTHDVLKEDVSQAVKQVNVVSKRCPSGLSAAETQRLLQVAGQSKHGHAKRNYALLHLMLQTGLRVNEVAALTRRDLHLSDRSGIVHVRLGKGRKARAIPLNAKARRALRLYIASRHTDDAINADTVFLSERKTPLSTRAIQAIVTSLAKRANITRINVSPHTLRHTFAMNYLKQHPSNIVQLASLMGHESLDTTAIYTHPSMDDLANNLECMAAM